MSGNAVQSLGENTRRRLEGLREENKEAQERTDANASMSRKESLQPLVSRGAKTGAKEKEIDEMREAEGPPCVSNSPQPLPIYQGK